MKRYYSLITLFLFLISSYIFPQQDQFFQKIIEIGKSENRTMVHQDYLCNRFGGRSTGSDAYTNAANWALNEFLSWGLKAELDEVAEEAVGFNRGPWFGKMIKPSELYLEFGTPGYTSGTKGKQKGHVLVLPTDINKIDSLKDKIKGAWVLIDGENSGYPRDRDSINQITIKLTEAGALGTIQLTKIPFRLFDVRHIKSWGELPTLPDIKLIDTQFNQIKSLVGKGEEVILEFDIRNFFYQGPVKYHNVIAWIPGTQFPDEYVILGAHLDSYDHATGAVDNGSGVSRMMEAIRILTKAGVKPKRSIMVQLYAAEERGLIGSRAWVAKNKHKLSKISIMMNNDSGTNPVIAMGVPKVIYDFIKPIIEPIENLDLKYKFSLQETGMIRRAGRGGTDSHSFVMEGVPAPWLRTQGPHQYGTTWHSMLDTYDQIIPDAQEHSALVYALLAYQMANMDQLIPREGAFLPDGVYADLNTNKGRITLALDYENVPMTAANFIGLAEGKIKNEALKEEMPYYNGSIWHRVVPGHVIQAGMPKTEKETEGPGYQFPNEIYSKLSHDKAGMLGMANAGPHTNGSQFYITLGDRSYLDGNYTLFGWVAEGMDVVEKIVQGDTIKSIGITRIGERENEFVVTDESFRKMVDEAKTKVKVEEEKRAKDEEAAIKKVLPGAKSTVSGVKYTILKEGIGEKPNTGSILTVSYRGTSLLKEFPFVSTSEDGKPTNYIVAPETFSYTIGTTKINPGLDEILSEMKSGEKRKVVVPFDKAYGNNGFYAKMIEGKKRFIIPPFTSLVYEIEVTAIK
ncbi:MAG: M20/M25/M40 family metallo-hydrolase [Melioribacteraceae bacterium]|nr:M20/M25/M40 family metallo-hydrolase [Melioribacteraceae bacterium]